MLSLDAYLYELSNIFLLPVQLSVIAFFIYALFSLGIFGALFVQRNRGRKTLEAMQLASEPTRIKGYSMLDYIRKNPRAKREDLELSAMHELDYLRITTRIAPMLGLVATMIPMGPALKALSNGNVQGISESLIIAFTAVIFALLAASITFWIASVRKQWLQNDIRFVEEWMACSAWGCTESLIINDVQNNEEIERAA